MREKTTAPADTKVLSVRVPIAEAERIDADARAAGMNRNDFIRMKVGEKCTFARSEKLTELIGVLRQLTIMFDTYLGILERYVKSLEGKVGDDDLIPVLAEIDRAQDMMKLALKVQKQAVRVLRAMHDDVKR